jgi:glutathione S-transferase
MSILLHHYRASSFAEKVRLVMGYLNVEWQSVLVDSLSPRPHLNVLTGGYRRTPVLQIDSNIYCDTSIICRALSSAAGEGLLYSYGYIGDRLAEWADTQLVDVCRVLNQRPEALPDTIERVAPGRVVDYKRDRASLYRGSGSLKMSSSAALSYLATYLNDLSLWLQSGYVLGERPSIADFSTFHPLWSLAQGPYNASLLRAHPNIMEWMERMQAFGHGEFEESDSEEAIDTAFGSEPDIPKGSFFELPDVKVGDDVVVMPVDYGRVPVVGKLVSLSTYQISILRRTDETGGVVVHFPNAGFEIHPALGHEETD